MISKVEVQLIIEHALKNEDHLRIALAIVYDCAIELRRKIISDFLVTLETRLREVFPDWHLENNFRDNVFTQYVGMYLSRNNWAKAYKVGFEAQQSMTKGFIIGFKKPEIAPAILGGQLKKRMNEQYRAGRSSEWWEWNQWMADGHANWDSPETLIRLHQKDEAVSYFVDHLSWIATIAAPAIDAALTEQST
jgi:hypothetical protein